ncbi:MAG: phosphomannomutase [Actinomycetales bacterium]|nr:MAG: phosphomannomutase [Actinomycetales bacterium]
MTLIEQAEAWRDQDPDNNTRDALDQLLVQAQAGDPTVSQPALDELQKIFSGPLVFGTAGLRGPLGPGPGQMNRVVVSQTAAGFAAWLKKTGNVGGKVIIGYDARYNSEIFAKDSAEIMIGAGFEVLLSAEPVPTPVVAFGIKHFGCVAGIVVTASHNPPTDNGYKIYLGDGSQIIPPTDTEIAAEIAAVAAQPLSDIPRGSGWQEVDEELISAYQTRAISLLPEMAPRNISWVYTPMHGVGARVVSRVVAAAGFPAAIEVAEQIAPDPDFPTVSFPNPEEPGAIDLALALAKEQGADLVIANDPDADRCAVAAPVAGTWRMLTGDELGAILGEDAIRRGVSGTFACSVVSSTMLGDMAKANNRPFTTTLTGFKWIGRVPDLAFGYEEAIGYCCDSAAVPDKDGITALLQVLRIAAELKANGKTLSDRLDEIAETYGIYTTSQLSARVKDLAIISNAMDRIRSNPPSSLLKRPVTFRDLKNGGDLPATDAVELVGDYLRIVVRPSGTEPKLKCYLQFQVPVEQSKSNLSAARHQANQMLDELRSEMTKILGL